MTIVYCLILITCVGSVVYILYIDRTEELEDLQLKYEMEVLTKIASNTNDEIEAIKNVLVGFYINSYYNTLTQVISPYTPNDWSAADKESLITTMLQNITLTNKGVVEIIALDAAGEKVYFYSDYSGRDIRLAYDFFGDRTSLFHTASGNVEIIGNHVPPYILKDAPSSDMNVVTFYVNLYDIDYVADDKRIGVVIINIDPDVFIDPYLEEIAGIEGEILIELGQDILFKSSDEALHMSEDMALHPDKYLVNRIESDQSDIIFTNIIDKEKLYGEIQDSISPVLNIVWIGIAISLAISILFSRIYSKRVRDLISTLHKIEIGSPASKMQVHSNDEIGYLEKSFADMYERINMYIEDVYVSDLRRKTSEIQVLQSQINPHYIFNTLESIRMIAMMNGDEQAAKMISILGNMFRWNMQMKAMEVTVQEEMDFIQEYIELQRIRLDNAFEFNKSIPKEAGRLLVPKLILQPIIENALHHGGLNSTSTMKVTLTCEITDTLVFKVTDDGIGIEASVLEQIRHGLDDSSVENDLYSIGLRNVNQRIKLLFGDQYGLNIFSESGEGTEIIVTLPLK